IARRSPAGSRSAYLQHPPARGIPPQVADRAGLRGRHHRSRLRRLSRGGALPAEILTVESQEEAPWFVCHTKPRCEKKFAALLAAEKFEHYLPLVLSERHYPKQVKRFSKPLFPG